MLRKRHSGIRRTRRFHRVSSETESVLERLFSSVHVGIAYLDREFQYVRVNPAFAEACGQPVEAFIGKNHFDIASDPESEAVFHRVLETGQAYHAYGKPLEFTHAPAQGRVYWDWSLEPVRSNEGEITHLVLVITDVTAREKAQIALHQTQAMFVHLFESTPDANVLFDSDGKIVAINRLAEFLFGYNRQELVGQPVEMIAPGPLTGIIDRFLEEHQARAAAQASVQAGRAQQIEIQASRKDGSRFPAEVTLNPFQANQRLLVLGIVRDIREAQARSAELAEQSRLVRLLQDVAVAANEANSVLAAFQFTLDRLCKHLGWPVAHALMTEADNALNPTTIWCENLEARFRSFREVSENMRFRPGEGLPGMVLKTGQPAWFDNLTSQPNFIRTTQAQQVGLRTGMALPVMANREVVGVLEFFHEEDIPPDPRLMAILPHIGMQLGRVVERKRSEDALRQAAAQLRTVITNLPVILWVVDREGRLLMLEGRGAVAAGLDPSRLVGEVLLDHLQAYPDILRLMRRALNGEEIHTEVSPSDRSTFDIYLTPYYDDHWAIAGVIGLASDVSERKRMEGELEEMKHHLLQSAETERARLGQILHDGPLQDLYGAFYQVQEIKSHLDGPAVETAERVLQTLQQVSGTLRVICGELRPSTLVHLGLNKAIRSHAEQMQDKLDQMHIYFDLVDDRQAIPHVQRLGLFRVYQQLISNAVRHSEARHIWVRLRLSENKVVLEVQDNGKGFDIPGHWIELVRKGRLGLVGALERVQGLGGQMDITSNPGQGTLIRTTVPLYPESGQD